MHFVRMLSNWTNSCLGKPMIRCDQTPAWAALQAALDAGADALLAASVFHFGIHRIGDVKRYLSQQGYSVRTSALV